MADDYEASDPYWEKLARGVSNNNPEVFQLLGLGGERSLARIRGTVREVVRLKLDKRLFHNWLNPWAAKQFIALCFEHTGDILRETDRVFVRWVTNDKIMRDGIPDRLFEDTDGPNALRQGAVESSDQFFYSYAINKKERLAKFVIGGHDSSVILGIVFPKDVQNHFRSSFAEGELFQTTAQTGIVRVGE